MAAIGRWCGWWPAILCLAAGVAIRNCAVFAAAGPLALTTFYLRMDANAPMDALRVAIRCVLAGVVALVAAVALVIVVLAAVHGMWLPTHDRYHADIGLLLASVALLLFVLARGNVEAISAGIPAAAGMALLVGIVVVMVASGANWSLCALPLAVAGLMAMTGLRLLREVATGMLHGGLAP